MSDKDFIIIEQKNEDGSITITAYNPEVVNAHPPFDPDLMEITEEDRQKAIEEAIRQVLE